MNFQKKDGCNKMTCTNCRTFFCWLCQQELSRSNPYSHYQHPTSPCINRLFEGTEIEEDPLEHLDFSDDEDYIPYPEEAFDSDDDIDFYNL